MIEKINADLDKAKGHLQNAQEASSASEEMAKGIWETVGGLMMARTDLGFLRSPTLFAGEREITPQDTTGAVDAAATGYNEALAELSGAMEGSSNSRIDAAKLHLHNAVDLLRESHMDATTQAKIVEDNFRELGEGLKKIQGLLRDMSDYANSVESSAWSSGTHVQNAVDSIESYQNRL